MWWLDQSFLNNVDDRICVAVATWVRLFPHMNVEGQKQVIRNLNLATRQQLQSPHANKRDMGKKFDALTAWLLRAYKAEQRHRLGNS